MSLKFIIILLPSQSYHGNVNKLELLIMELLTAFLLYSFSKSGLSSPRVSPTVSSRQWAHKIYKCLFLGAQKFIHCFLLYCNVGFAAAQYRQYQRLTKQMKPSADEYKKEKEQKFVLHNNN